MQACAPGPSPPHPRAPSLTCHRAVAPTTFLPRHSRAHRSSAAAPDGGCRTRTTAEDAPSSASSLHRRPPSLHLTFLFKRLPCPAFPRPTPHPPPPRHPFCTFLLPSASSQ
eukprot:7393900-Pyramimonas_sp.AAC.1